LGAVLSLRPRALARTSHWSLGADGPDLVLTFHQRAVR